MHMHVHMRMHAPHRDRQTTHALLRARTELAGISINCGGKRGQWQPHVQSFLWATDRSGLRRILEAGAIYNCGDLLQQRGGRDTLINRYELGMSKAVLEAGYAIAARLVQNQSGDGMVGVGGEESLVVQGGTSRPPTLRSHLPWCSDVWSVRRPGAARQRATLLSPRGLAGTAFWKASRGLPSEVQRHAAEQDRLYESG